MVKINHDDAFVVLRHRHATSSLEGSSRSGSSLSLDFSWSFMPASVASSGTAEFEVPGFLAEPRSSLRILAILFPHGEHSSMDELFCFAHAVECSDAGTYHRPQVKCTIPSFYWPWAQILRAGMQRRFRVRTLSSAAMLASPRRRSCLICFRPWPVEVRAIRTAAVR